jgi:hypothetical protein
MYVEPDFHICTGRTPSTDILMTITQMRNPIRPLHLDLLKPDDPLNPLNLNPLNLDPLNLDSISLDPISLDPLNLDRISLNPPIRLFNESDWMTERYGPDPISTYLQLLFLLLIAIAFQIWIYSNMSAVEKVWLVIRDKFRNCKSDVEASPDVYIGNQAKNRIEKFLETKSSILGTSQFIAMIFVGIAAVLPVNISKEIAKKNIQEINHGNGRRWAYLAKLTMPIFFFLIFPLLLIGFNAKVRKCLIKELKASVLGQWMISIFVNRFFK